MDGNGGKESRQTTFTFPTPHMVERVGLLMELEVKGVRSLVEVEVEVERVGSLLEVELEEGVELEPLVDADTVNFITFA